MTASSTTAAVFGLALLTGLPFCTKETEVEVQVEVEGDAPGECADGADNDLDRIIDCEDPGCTSDPICMNPPYVALGHCASGEATYFNCTVENGKSLSLCGAPDLEGAGGWLQYRYGKLNSIERGWPEERAGSLPKFRYSVLHGGAWFGPQCGGESVYHDSGPHRFAVYTNSCVSTEYDSAGVIVFKKGKMRPKPPTCLQGSVHDELGALEGVLKAGGDLSF